jgi:hypothetical protein
MKRISARDVRRFARVAPFVFISALCVLVAALLIFFVFRTHESAPLRRVNFVLASSPVSVWSWDRDSGKMIVVLVPADTVINAIGGYGVYSLDAIWKLGSLEKRDRALFAGSVSDALGVSIPFYFGNASEDLGELHDPVAYGREVFSISHLFRLIFGGYRTNISPRFFLSFVKAFGQIHVDQISVVDLAKKNITVDDKQPDDSTRRVLDSVALDAVLQGDFEDDQVRQEGVSVILLNTTSSPSLGSRAARLLTSSGVRVVSVGNDENEVKECQLEGDQISLSSLTARFITSLFQCHQTRITESRRSDLTVRLGSEFASRFESYKK